MYSIRGISNNIAISSPHLLPIVHLCVKSSMKTKASTAYNNDMIYKANLCQMTLAEPPLQLTRLTRKNCQALCNKLPRSPKRRRLS